MDRRAVLLIAVLVAAVAAYGAWWLALARAVDKGIQEWIEARRAEGWRIEHGRIETSGFPFRLIAEVEGPKLAAQGWSWSGAVVRAVAKPWDFGHIFAMAEGPQLFGFEFDGQRREATLEAEKMLASFRQTEGRIRRADVDLTKPVLASAAFGGTTSAERLQIHFRANSGETADRPADTADVALSADGALLPAERAGPLGPALSRASMRARLKGEIGGSKEALAAWRDGGGTIEIDGAKLVWGPLEAELNATLALDKAWRLLGAGTLKARGYDKTIDAVEAAKLLRPVEAQMLRIALAVKAKRDADPRAFVELPVTAQDGRLSVGPVPVLRLQPLF